MNKLRSLIFGYCLFVAGASFAYDNGPQVIGCDYQLGKSEGIDKCLIIGSGLNQGTSWVVFEVKGMRFRYEDSTPNSIEVISSTGEVKAKHKVTNGIAQCRPGGRSADVYSFENGDRICLYWN